MADKEEKKPKETKPPVPETVALKDVAKQAGVEPREARSILRKLSARGETEKRSRWQFVPKDVAGVVAKIKKAVADKAKAKEEAVKEE